MRLFRIETLPAGGSNLDQLAMMLLVSGRGPRFFIETAIQKVIGYGTINCACRDFYPSRHPSCTSLLRHARRHLMAEDGSRVSGRL